MVDIHSNILEKLHCNKCNEYLSYAPIMLTEDGENLCGRCVTEATDKKLIRNKAYEDIASIAAFPCRYKESGCEVTIPWDDMNIHEDHCEYRPIDCPVAPEGTCKWMGPQHTLLNHYEETHPELILEYPCSLDTNIVVDNDKNMLISFLGFVFLVQIRCNTGLSKLWHCVHCFAQPKIAHQFSFCVQFSSDEGSFKKEKPVLAEKCLNIQIEKSVETNVNNLLGLLGDCKNIKVVLSILPKVLPAIFRNNEKYYCANCKCEDSFFDGYMEYLIGKMLKSCKNINFGCPYVNMNKKLIYRHEIWECKWQKQCFFDCVLSFNELQNHFVNKAHNSNLDTYLRLNSTYYGQINKDSNIILFKYLMKKTFLEVYIYTQLPVDEFHLYKCIIRFARGANVTLNCTPTAEHDWEICQILENNPYLDRDNDSKIIDIIISKDQ